jgi:hypothetical protein
VKKLLLYLFLREVAKDPFGAKELHGEHEAVYGGTL